MRINRLIKPPSRRPRVPYSTFLHFRQRFERRCRTRCLPKGFCYYQVRAVHLDWHNTRMPRRRCAGGQKLRQATTRGNITWHRCILHDASYQSAFNALATLNEDDRSNAAYPLRDDDPQSDGSAGKAYDSRAPHVFLPCGHAGPILWQIHKPGERIPPSVLSFFEEFSSGAQAIPPTMAQTGFCANLRYGPLLLWIFAISRY
jgi:hypothetical protein